MTVGRLRLFDSQSPSSCIALRNPMSCSDYEMGYGVGGGGVLSNVPTPHHSLLHVGFTRVHTGVLVQSKWVSKASLVRLVLLGFLSPCRALTA